MNVSVSSSTGWSTYTAYADAQAAHARLSGHLAAGADPQVIAADRAGAQRSAQLLAQTVGRFDIMV
jgi:hypothetical protein